MDIAEYRKILSGTVQKIFEDAAFALVDPPEDEEVSESIRKGVEVVVDFKGPFSGIVAISVSRELAVMSAANMLGIEEDDTEADDKSIDAVKEITNMICGNYLPVIAGEAPEFRIGMPRRITTDEFNELEKDESGAKTVTGSIYVEGYETRILYVERK